MGRIETGCTPLKWQKYSEEMKMPKGYLVANIRVNDTEVFKKFSQTALPIIEQFGGKILARGPHADRHEGNVAGVVTMLEFESK